MYKTYMQSILSALAQLQEQVDKDKAAGEGIGTMELQELEAQLAWEFTMQAKALMHIICSYQAAESHEGEQ